MSVYAEAAELIRKDGWAQGWFYRPGRGHCVFGAIQAVTNGNPDQRSPRSDALVGRLEDVIGCGLGIEEWNDEPGRTVEDVINLLEQVDRQESK